MQTPWLKKPLSFRNAIPNWRGGAPPWQPIFFFFLQSNISCAWNKKQVHLSCMGNWKSSCCQWTWECESPMVCVVRTDQSKFIGPLFFEEPTVNGDRFLAIMQNTTLHCASVGRVFLVTRCTTPFLPSCSCLSGQGVSWSLDRVKGNHSSAPSISTFDFSGLFFWGFVKRVHREGL